MRSGFVVAVCGLLGLVGCGGGAGTSAVSSAPVQGSLSDAALTGVVSSGTQPVVGAHVYLFAASTTGYGGDGIAASSSNASVSLVSAAQTGSSDSVGAYVTTNANGGFSLTGDYSCTSGQQLYLYALGGNAGSGVNSAIGLMAAIGSCPSAGSSAISATVNGASTIAAAYAFAGFATDATHVGSSGTALAQVGIANAFANAGNLVTLPTGVALTTTPAGNGTAQPGLINTLSNALASCAVTSSAASSACVSLFTKALSKGTSGTAPTDTATAAINLAHHPGTVTPNQPLSIQYSGGGLYFPNSIAIDGSGNAWITSNRSGGFAEFSNLGAVLSGPNGYIFGGDYGSYGVAIDQSGNAWVIGEGTIFKFSSTGSLLSGTNGFVVPDAGVGISGANAIAIDRSSNVWIVGDGSVFELSNSGVILSGNNFISDGLTEGYGLAFDGSDNVWFFSQGKVRTVCAIWTLSLPAAEWKLSPLRPLKCVWRERLSSASARAIMPPSSTSAIAWPTRRQRKRAKRCSSREATLRKPTSPLLHIDPQRTHFRFSVAQQSMIHGDSSGLTIWTTAHGGSLFMDGKGRRDRGKPPIHVRMAQVWIFRPGIPRTASSYPMSQNRDIGHPD